MASIETMDLARFAGREAGTSVLVKELARGGMGAVFIAYQRTLKRRIAVKVLPKVVLTEWSAELFRQEAEAAAILSHAGIVPIYEVGETEDFLFYSMQLVQGRSLSDYLEKIRRNVLPSRRIMPLKAALHLMIAVLDALDYAHGEEVVHRDVKPGNILIEARTARPLLTDFGIAQILRGPDMKHPRIVGSPVYMAPEQIKGLRVDARADVYSAGVVLFEALTPRLPVPPAKGKRELLKLKMELKEKWFRKLPSHVNPVLDRAMDAIVLKAVRHDPEKRYSSCRELAADLGNYLNRRMKRGS